MTIKSSALPHQKKEKLYYFLIWGHGMPYKDKIFNILENHEKLEILYVMDHEIKNIKKFIKEIYAHDYAPFYHLKTKTRYLLKTPKVVRIIIVKTKTPDIDFFGKLDFRHEESRTIKEIKEHIRNQYNPRENGKRSEHHVIHACDNPHQLNQLLLYLNYKYSDFDNANQAFSIPFYLGKKTELLLKKVSINQLYANILMGNAPHAYTTLSVLDQTPHYKALTQSPEIYANYLNQYIGTYLKTYYSVEKFIELSKDLSYLTGKYRNNYILTKEIKPNQYQILDGLHRASILNFKGKKEIIIGVLS